jgi:hypothetical protein
METIFAKPIDIITFEDKRLIGVTKTILDMQLDIMTFYMGERTIKERNRMYTIINVGTVEQGFLNEKL